MWKKLILIAIIAFVIWKFFPSLITVNLNNFVKNIMNSVNSVIKNNDDFNNKPPNTTTIDFKLIKKNITNTIKQEKTIQKVTNTRNELDTDVQNALNR